MVGAALFIFFLLFMSQFINFQEINHKKTEMTSAVAYYSQQARMAGYFTPEIKDEMITQIHERTGIEKSEIKVTLTESLKCTRQGFSTDSQINYEVKIPIKNVIAGASFLGIDEADNMHWYSREGSVSSEKLCDN